MEKQLRIEFEEMPWENTLLGAMQKVVLHKKQKLRLLRFTDVFVEEHWCTKGHVGYVLEGEMTIDFSGNIIPYKKGDALWIHAGEAEKHKVQISKGQFVELILFEEAD